MDQEPKPNRVVNLAQFKEAKSRATQEKIAREIIERRLVLIRQAIDDLLVRIEEFSEVKRINLEESGPNADIEELDATIKDMEAQKEELKIEEKKISEILKKYEIDIEQDVFEALRNTAYLE